MQVTAHQSEATVPCSALSRVNNGPLFAVQLLAASLQITCILLCWCSGWNYSMSSPVAFSVSSFWNILGKFRVLVRKF